MLRFFECMYISVVYVYVPELVVAPRSGCFSVCIYMYVCA